MKHCKLRQNAYLIKNLEGEIKMNKIYCFINSQMEWGDVVVVALAEDGECVGSHISSNESWAMHDIGINSDWKHEEYRKHYPDGYELIWLEREELDTNEGLQRALKLNSELSTENNDNE
jgi:hypothetical protein